MSANGTARAKGITTKSKAAAEAAAEAQGAVIIQLPTGGKTLVGKAEAKRRQLIDAAKAEQAAADKLVEEVIAEATVTEPETTEQVIAREVAEGKLTPVGPAPKKPWAGKKLAGAAEAGKQPKKGQLPAGLLAYLAKKHQKSTIIAAAAGAPVKATKKGKAKK